MEDRDIAEAYAAAVAERPATVQPRDNNVSKQ
jgi:hypothetical protein